MCSSEHCHQASSRQGVRATNLVVVGAKPSCRRCYQYVAPVRRARARQYSCLMSPMPLNELILIGPDEYTKRGYYFQESGEMCLMFVLPGYQWPEGKKPSVPQ